MEEAPLDLAGVADTADQVVQKAAVPRQTYPDSELGARTWRRFRCDSLTRHTRAASPLLPAPGVGQVGPGLEDRWGLEEDADEEDEKTSGEETAEEEEEEEEQRREHTPAGWFLLIDASPTVVPLVKNGAFL